MNKKQLTALMAERDALLAMIADIPEEDVIDRGSFQARLESVEELIGQGQQAKDPARAILTFRGRPVIGSHGIFAEFGMKAVNGFSDAVAAVAASMTAPLRPMGPIPNRDQNQLLITNTAIGSFGFELEELPATQLKLDEVSVVEQALDKTQDLLEATLHADDEALADSAAELDKRAIDKIRSFVATLADYEALCAFEFKERRFRFDSPEQVSRAIERMSDDNLQESTENLEGWFEGVLPNKRRSFEFRVSTNDDVVVGRIGPGVEHPEEINRHLMRRCAVRVQVTRVGRGKPRYLLLEMPRWQ